MPGAGGVEGQRGRSPPPTDFGSSSAVLQVSGSSESRSPVHMKLSPLPLSAEVGKKNLLGKKTCVSHTPGVGRAKEARGLKFPLLDGIYL